MKPFHEEGFTSFMRKDPSEDRKEEEYRSLALDRYTANSSQS